MPNKEFLMWSAAHESYDLNSGNHLSLPDGFSGIEGLVKLNLLLNHEIANSPHFKLLSKNILIDSLSKEKIYLIHTTTNMDKILQTQTLYSSSGCLVGSPYCTLAIKNGDNFRLHNLGGYVNIHEAPASLKIKNDLGGNINRLIIEVDLPKQIHTRPIGINYLKLGMIHYTIYKDLEYLLSNQERYLMKQHLIEKIRGGVEFLHIVTDYIKTGKESFDSSYFFDKYNKAIEKMPVLGYIYFESISEYLQLFSTDSFSNLFSDYGEINNRHYKHLMFKLCPNLLERFNLGKFRPSINELKDMIDSLTNDGFCKIDFQHFVEYIKNRIIYYTSITLLTPDCFTNQFNWQSLIREFDELVGYANPLLGHLIHRELRNFGRYPDFYFYFEQEKALKIWNYRNHMNIIFPFNGITPKGEIGLNPAYSELSYKIYDTEVIDQKNTNEMYITPTKKILDINIVPRLVDIRNSFMRIGKQDDKNHMKINKGSC